MWCANLPMSTVLSRQHWFDPRSLNNQVPAWVKESKSRCKPVNASALRAMEPWSLLGCTYRYLLQVSGELIECIPASEMLQVLRWCGAWSAPGWYHNKLSLLLPKQAASYCQVLPLEKKIALNAAGIWAGKEWAVFTEHKFYVCKQAHVSVSCMEYATKISSRNARMCPTHARCHTFSYIMTQNQKSYLCRSGNKTD